MTLDLPHILATASFTDVDARAECERRVREAVKAENEACAKIADDEDGEISYSFNMSILSIDLEG